MKALFLIGRIVFGGFFLYNGINHFKQKAALAGYAGSKNVPNPELAVLASGIALAAGGASIILGAKPKLGTLAILGFLATVSPTIHDFWSVADPQQKQNEMINFSKNMALLGAALALAGVEEWPLSVAS
jgi:putative oxidoreductase